MCGTFIAEWQGQDCYAEDRALFEPFGILPDYLFNNNSREIVGTNFGNITDFPGLSKPYRLSEIATVMPLGRAFILEHEHQGEGPPRIPQYQAGPVSGGTWALATVPFYHNLSRGRLINNCYDLTRSRMVSDQGYVFGDMHVEVLNFDDVYTTTGAQGAGFTAGPRYGYPWP